MRDREGLGKKERESERERETEGGVELGTQSTCSGNMMQQRKMQMKTLPRLH